MSTFSQRYAGVNPTHDPAPVDLRDELVRFLGRFIGARPLREIVSRTAGRNPDAQMNWSDENVLLETRDVARTLDWRMFYDAVQDVVAGFGGRDRTVAGEAINGLFNDYRMPWMLTVDGGIVAVPGRSDGWGLSPHDRTAASAKAEPCPVRSDPSKSSWQPPDAPAAPRQAPKQFPESLLTLVAGLLAVPTAYAAAGDFPRVVRIWSGVASGLLVLLAVGLGVHVYQSWRAGPTNAARTSRRLTPVLCIAATAFIVAGAIFQFHSRPPVADVVRPVDGTEFTSTLAPAGEPRRLTLAQQNAIADFARAHGRHTVSVLSADGTETLVYAGSLADAFEAGGWIVPGRRNDETRAVTHRLGGLLPNEQVSAVAPDDGLGAQVKLALENIGLHPTSWPRSLGSRHGDVSVWIGRVP